MASASAGKQHQHASYRLNSTTERPIAGWYLLMLQLRDFARPKQLMKLSYQVRHAPDALIWACYGHVLRCQRDRSQRNLQGEPRKVLEVLISSTDMVST